MSHVVRNFTQPCILGNACSYADLIFLVLETEDEVILTCKRELQPDELRR